MCDVGVNDLKHLIFSESITTCYGEFSMKKILLIGFLVLFFSINLTGCVSFLIACVVSTQSVEKETKEAIIEKNLPIVVTHVSTSSPNSVGGVDCSIAFRNLSNQQLKYVTFEVLPINAVGDYVECEVKKRDWVNLKVTGPVSIDDPSPPMHKWGACWYNSSIKKCKIVSINVVFMDGTQKKYNEEETQQMMRSYYEGK